MRGTFVGNKSLSLHGKFHAFVKNILKTTRCSANVSSSHVVRTKLVVDFLKSAVLRPAVRLSCKRDITGLSINWYVGDAGNTPLVDAGTPLGATAVVTPGSAGYLHFWSAASWRPCDVARPVLGRFEFHPPHSAMLLSKVLMVRDCLKEINQL